MDLMIMEAEKTFTRWGLRLREFNCYGCAPPHPSERHEEGEGARDGDDEAVLDVARVRHLLQRDPR